tara:strand:- start:1973 stop:2923 length:951 start_codon:yes stop_codon:yes gene_type:complete
MQIEVRNQGKRKKYYLAHSFREGKRVRKIRRYLGMDLSEKQLEKLIPRAEEILKEQVDSYKIIKDPLKNVLNEKELNVLESLENKGKIKIKHLSKDDWRLFTELFTYNTNAIEGSEVKLKEVKEILEENKWPKDVSKNDVSETYGVAEAVDYIRNVKEHLSVKLIKKLHHIVFKNSKDFAGKLRGKGVEVVIRDGGGNVVHVGAPSNRIKGLLEELIDWYDKNKKKYPSIVLASIVHNQFENIHPFEDGNGRVGRLLLNNILLKHDLPPVNIGFKNRREYYGVLREYQNKGDIAPTVKLILKEYKNLKKDLGDYKK